MSIICFDICSVPLFLMLLFICYSRRMTRGNANRLFILLVLLSLFSAVADLGIETSENAAPPARGGVRPLSSRAERPSPLTVEVYPSAWLRR